MSKIYVVRHGQTNMNIQRIMQGRTDSVLNDIGRAQAKDAKDLLTDKGIEVKNIIASPLLRAKETASIISGIPIDDISTDDRLMEMDFGEFEGHSINDLKTSQEEAIFKRPDEFVPCGGESYKELIQRGASIIEEKADLVRKEKLKEDLFLVSHGALLHAIYLYIKNIPLRDFWQLRLDNLSILTIEVLEEALQVDVLFEGFSWENYSVAKNNQ